MCWVASSACAGLDLASLLDALAEVVEPGLDLTEPDEVDAEDVEQADSPSCESAARSSASASSARRAIAIATGRHERRREAADDPGAFHGRRIGRDELGRALGLLEEGVPLADEPR